MKLVVHIDGGIFPNPGKFGSYGFVVSQNGKEIYTENGCEVSENLISNNSMEYLSLLKFLMWFNKQQIDDVIINSDSALLVNQMKGKWQASVDKLYFPYFNKIMKLIAANIDKWEGKFEFVLIPREENEIADALATEARLAYNLSKNGDK